MTASYDPPYKLVLGVAVGLQFTTVRCRPEKTGQGRWSSLNRSERPRPELLMRLG